MLLSVATAAVGCCLIYTLSLVVYRLFFHPLRHIPGPRLAAATLWYEFYYDVVLQGQYQFKIIRLHDEYGKLLPGNVLIR